MGQSSSGTQSERPQLTLIAPKHQLALLPLPSCFICISSTGYSAEYNATHTHSHVLKNGCNPQSQAVLNDSIHTLQKGVEIKNHYRALNIKSHHGVLHKDLRGHEAITDH